MIHRLHPQIQHYAWGGYRYLPELLGLPVPQDKPCAELWMGAHPGAPSTIQTAPLPEHIAADPARWLGEAVARQFAGQFPFLFKILDVRQMLSIQAHPAKAKAEAGFRRENELDIPLDAPNRVYKDANHKPELMVALSEFWLLHGFRRPEAIQAELERVEELRPLSAHFNGEDLPGLYRYLMEMPQSEADKLLRPLRARLAPLLDAGTLPKSSPDYWAALAFRDFELPGGHCDRGVFSIYLLNLLQLQPGQGIFQAAGIPHAYLEGQNVELMANSDNVFRGGLTPKYIAVQELLDNLVFEPVEPRILAGEPASAHETAYPTPAPDFALSRLTLPAMQEFACPETKGPELLLLIQGAVITGDGERFGQGEVMYAMPGEGYRLKAESEAVVYRARVSWG